MNSQWCGQVCSIRKKRKRSRSNCGKSLPVTLYDLKGHQTGSDLSVGIALAPEDGLEIDELLNHADLALYGAKAEGRGSYRYYEPEMNARMKWRRPWSRDLFSSICLIFIVDARAQL